MHEALWDLLTDEELAEQADEWRYAGRRHQDRRRFGLARWSYSISIAASNELSRRLEEREMTRNAVHQLVLEERMPTRIAPELRGA